MANTSVEFSGKHIRVRLEPRLRFSPLQLRIESRDDYVEMEFDEDQLSEIAFTIQQYLDSIRYDDAPDRQRILNHEIEKDIEEGVAL